MNPRLRDVLIFISGLAIMVHQTVFADSVSSTLVGAALGMMLGAPAIFRLLDWLERRPPKEGK